MLTSGLLAGAVLVLASSDSPAPIEVLLTGPGVGQRDVPYTFTAAVTPLTATLPLTFTWEATGQDTVVHTVEDSYTDTVSYTWSLTGAHALTLTVSNPEGSANAHRTILIDPEYQVYLPLVLRDYPPGPRITAFYANVEHADPGQTIILTWTSYKAVTATLWLLNPLGQFSNWWSVAPCGSMEYTIPPEQRNFERFALYVQDSEGRWDWAYLTIPLTCPHDWFFEPDPNECAARPPLISAGAQQRFERGVMLWVQGQDRIYVLYDDGGVIAWEAFTDEWDAGEPEKSCDVGAPPEGRYQPVRGFGLVWCQESVRGRLGWATELEHSYETAVQSTARWRYDDLYIRAYEGGTWWLKPERSGWEYLPPCEDDWFFEPDPRECPAGPALISAGAQQPFERGVMLWVQGEDRIYVLYGDNGEVAWEAFTDEWDAGEPEKSCDVGEPPPGYYQPIRGFGLVWCRADVRGRVGWATAPEQGYGTAVQRSSQDTYIRALDGGTWRLGPAGSGWEYLPVPLLPP